MASHQLRIQTSSPFHGLREPIWSGPPHHGSHSSGFFIPGLLPGIFLLLHTQTSHGTLLLLSSQTQAQASSFGDTFPFPLNPNSSTMSVWPASPFWVFPNFPLPVILMGYDAEATGGELHFAGRRLRVRLMVCSELTLNLHVIQSGD